MGYIRRGMGKLWSQSFIESTKNTLLELYISSLCGGHANLFCATLIHWARGFHGIRGSSESAESMESMESMESVDSMASRCAARTRHRRLAARCYNTLARNASTVAILAQGTSLALASQQAFLLRGGSILAGYFRIINSSSNSSSSSSSSSSFREGLRS
jgi:hypothetical protein